MIGYRNARTVAWCDGCYELKGEVPESPRPEDLARIGLDVIPGGTVPLHACSLECAEYACVNESRRAAAA